MPSNAQKQKSSVKLKPLDAVIITIIAALSLSTLFFLPKRGTNVLVLWHGERIYSGRLDSDAELTTPDGQNTITISDGRAYMSHAECADGTCVHMGYASSARPVVCLPNRVMIIITDETGVDSVTW